MPLPRFHWHPDARVFLDVHQVTKATSPPPLAASPVTQALQVVEKALTNQTPFCVSDTAPPPLDHLDPAWFATLTGGTSGPPKVIARSQASWIASFHTNASQFAYSPTDSIAVLGALTHSLALYGLLEGLHLGHDVHILSGSKPTAQSNALRQSHCTILYATPTQLHLLPIGTILPDIRLILCGGGTLNRATRNHIHTICPNAALHVFYGAAETSFITLSDAQAPEGSVGRAYPDVEIEIRTADSMGIGLIWVRSPYLFEGYLKGESSHTQRDGDWLTVGEYGTMDEQGYLYLRGRAGRMINIADTAVFPEELEAQIAAMPEMPNCAILVRLDAMRGRHLVAVIEESDNPQLRDRLMTYCKQQGLIAPRTIEFMKSFPLLPSGKPDLTRIAALTGCVL
ncbi:AMP-binding protein [uncultured Sulfitobacter sp.]|uniref:AMP-binding protein n=1 Tax=uncultured Sulfitobacter sp. TaxID=191468 RepID=UPI00262A83B7|nr:AMP-binding protein [uncultured Sulfitobacter sp.]